MFQICVFGPKNAKKIRHNPSTKRFDVESKTAVFFSKMIFFIACVFWHFSSCYELRKRRLNSAW